MMTMSATEDTAATLARHIQAVTSGDVDAVLRNFSDESVVFTPDGRLHGLSAIRKDTEAFFESSPPAMMPAFQIVRQDVDGEVAYLLWKAEPFVTLAAETFVVRAGKIVAQTFAVLGGEGMAA
jgi:ketosteroid isomerase-like protein